MSLAISNCCILLQKSKFLSLLHYKIATYILPIGIVVLKRYLLEGTVYHFLMDNVQIQIYIKYL